MMTRKHYIAIAKVLRASDLSDDQIEGVAIEMADMLEQPGMAKNFDREMFLAFATSKA